MAREKLSESEGVQHLVTGPVPTDIDLRHFVLLTEPNGEVRARDALKRRGFDPYVPIEEFTSYRTIHKFFGVGRRKVEGARPIFRGYLFLPLNRAWSYGPVYGCPGVRQSGSPFLTINERPVTLSAVILERIRRIERSLMKPEKSPYKVGDPVYVDGFGDIIAKIHKLDDSGRIKVLMEWLGAERETETSALKISPAS